MLLSKSLRLDCSLASDLCYALAGTLDYSATGKATKNCDPSKSHFCLGKKGVGSCVSLSKSCSFPATGVALQAATLIAQRKPKTVGASVKSAAKPSKITPAFDVDAAVKAVEASDIPKFEKSSSVSALRKLDPVRESHRAYGDAIVESLGLRGGDSGDESSLDRTRELFRISNRANLVDDDVTEAADFLRQGLRGTSGSWVNEANKLLGRDIYDRLSEPQKDAFAVAANVNVDAIQKDPKLSNDPFIQELKKRGGTDSR